MSKRGWHLGWSGIATCLFACQTHQATPFANPGPPTNTTATAFVAAAHSSSTSSSTSWSTTSPPSATPTPVEQAIAQHRDAILRQRGVVAVDAGVLPDGSAAMLIEMCAEEAKKSLTLPELAVPVNVFVDPASTRASSKPCGCVFDGAYYEVGEGRKVDCNHCSCKGGGKFLCTLLDCEIKILSRVSFNANSAEPLPDALPVYAAIVEVLRDKQDFLIEVQGYADKGEKDPQGLSLRRARAVYDRLVSAGASRERLRGPTALGSTKPVSADKPELNRQVRFEVIMRP